MRIVCVGGGPAGLYFAILTKLADPDHEVTVLERNPAGVTYGWGVTFRDDLLDDLFRCDPVSAQDIWNSAAKWDEYITSQKKIAKAAADAGASVILSNHSEYDGAYTKARLVGAKREAGEENPFIVGAAGVQRYFTVMAECAEASKLRAGAK